MATRTITTSIALDGEQKFKQQMGEVNRELRNLNSEMGLVEETFKGQANTTEALTAKGELLRREVEQQEEKVRALEGALEDATKAFGETDAKTDSYRQSLNRAQTDLLKLNRALADNDRYLEEARESADDCASSIDEFGREVKDVDFGNMDGSGSIGGLVKHLGDLKGVLAGGAVVGGLIAAKDAIFGIVDATAEYRKTMAALETGGQAQGYSVEETKELYEELYAVMGDDQAAAEAAAQLQTLNLGQENLSKTTEGVIGMWVKLGQSAPIESLAEAVSQTIHAGTATGAFADYLVAAGISEDEFNAKLQESKTYGDRVTEVLNLMANEGLDKTAQAFHDNNGEMEDFNRAQADMKEAMGKLGEALSPAATALLNFGSDAVVVLTGMFTDLIDGIKDAFDWFGKISGKMNEMEIPNNAVPAGRLGTMHMANEFQEPTASTAYTDLVEAVTPSASASAKSAAATAANMSSMSGGRMGSGGVVIPITLELDGAVLARKQARYDSRQQTLSGSSMID